MVRGAIHKHSIQALKRFNTPQNKITKLLKHIYQLAIIYLVYLVLMKRELDNKQTQLEPP